MRLIPYPEFKNITTLRMGGRGILEIVIDNVKDFEFLPLILEKEGGLPFVLGNGSNILVEDGLIPVVLVRVGFEKDIKVVAEYPNEVILRVGAFVPMSRLIRFCIRGGVSGIERLAGIPGTVGGAIAMNAGSFGCEIKDVVKRITLWGEASGFVNIDRDSVNFGYRSFYPGIEDEFWCVVDVDFLFKKDFPVRVKDRVCRFYLEKKKSQPILKYTCGCVFKNPSKDLSAGYLLDSCGMKGFRVGDVEFSELHANFLINRGNGRAKDALELISIAKEKVKEMSGIELEMEVKLLKGEF